MNLNRNSMNIKSILQIAIKLKIEYIYIYTYLIPFNVLCEPKAIVARLGPIRPSVSNLVVQNCSVYSK